MKKIALMILLLVFTLGLVGCPPPPWWHDDGDHGGGHGSGHGGRHGGDHYGRGR